MLHTEHQRTVLKTWLTPQQRQEMRLWLLTKWNRWKSHTSVLYSWYDPDNPKKNWHNAFLAFSQTPLYKKWIWESEERFMHKYAERITKHIPQWTQQLVELWPWNDKMQTYMHFLLSYHDRLRLQYRPADVAKSALDDWLADAEKAGLRKWAPILWDWDNPVTFSQVQDAFYVCFGGWFVNSYNQLPQRISNMQWSGYIHRGRVFSTFFGMPGDDSMGEDDKVSLLKAIYGDMWTKDKPNNFGEQESYDKARDMVLQPFEALWFDTTKLDLGVERIQWDPNKIVLWARVIKSFIEKEWDEEYLYSPWDFIPLIDSPRPTVYQYTAQIQKWWGKVRDIFSYNGVVWSIVALPIKKLSKKDSKVLKTASAIAWVLLLVFGWIETWKMIERADRHKKQDKLKQEIVMGKQWVVNARHFTDWEEESEKMVYIFEHRYGNAMSEQTRETLQAMIKDFLLSEKWYQFLNKYKRMWQWWPDHYDHLYTPTILHQFVADNPTQLKNLHINTVAHSNLLQHYEALRNTYFYQWDVVSFEDSDVEEIGIYRSEHVWWVIWDDRPNNWEPDWMAVKCGIVKRKWKEYFIQKLGNDPYRLSEKNSAMRSQWIMSSGDMAAEILSKGQTQIITEKIYTLLVNQYWDRYPMYINWREEIAHWLLDWYAKGWDLEFLMYASENILYFESNILKDFVLRFAIPTLSQNLEKTMTANDIDRVRVHSDTEAEWSIIPTVELIHTFLDTYLWFQYTWERVQSWRVKSTLVRLLLTDKIWEKVDMCDPQIIRAWITKHAATFRENGIMVPVFPEWIDKFLANKGGPKYFPEDDLKHLKENEDLNANYSRSQFNDVYIDINWSSYTCWVYQKNMFAQWRFVAKMQNQRIQDALWKQYQEGKFWKIYSESDLFSSGYELKDKWEIIHRLLKIHTEYSSQNAHNLMADYAKWKQAMEKVK